MSETDAPSPREPAGPATPVRYRAIRLPRRSVNLSAGVEDLATGEIIRIANASMAIRVAELMNDEAAGRSLPPARPRHFPSRFQIAHDPALPTPGALVQYVHSLQVRLVAYAPTEHQARHVARLLARIDYPMDERDGVAGLLIPPRAADLGDELESLPEPAATLERLTVARRESRVRRLALTSLAGWLPLIAVVAAVALLVNWPWALAIAGAGLAAPFLLRHLLCQ